jgi:NADH-quinone oxidoreductase subunit H
MNEIESIIDLLVFPGFLFLTSFAFACQYIDRKLYARFQKRVGPPFIQPLADFIKLLSKEDIVPKAADRTMFTAAPIVGLAAVLTAFVFIPVLALHALIPSFEGDLIMVLYLLTIPSLAIFLAGWSSGNPFGQIGAMRAVVQMLSYEIPFFLALLAPALVVESWSLGAILDYQLGGMWLVLLAPLGLFVAIITLQGKLERLPFDIPDAETEIVGGPMAEYSGRRLALFRAMLDIEMVVGAALIVTLFLGGYDLIISFSDLPWYLPYIVNGAVFFLKVLLIVGILALIKAVVARYRIDQMVSLSYRWMIPLSVAQIIVIVALKFGGWF